MTAPTVPLRSVADVRVSNVDKKSDASEKAVRLCNYTDVYYNGVITDRLPLMTATATPQQIARFGLMGGDSIITKDSETVDDIGVPTFVPVDLPGVVCDYHLALIRPQPKIDPRFLSWALHSGFVSDQLAVRASGVTRFGLTYGAIKGLQIPSLALPEQRRIADFLDDQVTRIDKAIQRRRTMIERMAERLRSETQSLVLGRIDQSPCRSPEGPLLPVPSGWQARGDGYFTHEVGDPAGGGSGGMRTVSHVTGVAPRSEETVYMFEAATNEGYKRVKPGDLVINTMWAWMGALGVAATSGIVSPAYGVYRFFGDGLNPRYFDALFRSPAYVTEMTRYSRGVWSSRLRLYPDSFLALTSPIPPISVQDEIASHVDAAKLGVASSTDALERSLALLEERKRSLITAAVTGEFDVSSASVRASGEAIDAPDAR